MRPLLAPPTNPWAAYPGASPGQVCRQVAHLRYCRQAVQRCRMSRPGDSPFSSFVLELPSVPPARFPSSISATHLSVVPYVLVLYGLTRWHSLSWLIDRWPPPPPPPPSPPPRSTSGIGSTPSPPAPQTVHPSLFFWSIFLISSIKCFRLFSRCFSIMVMRDIAFPSSKN